MELGHYLLHSWYIIYDFILYVTSVVEHFVGHIYVH